MLRTTRYEWLQHAALAAGLIAMLAFVMSGASATSRAGSESFIRFDERLSPDLCPLAREHAAAAQGGLEGRARSCAFGGLEVSRSEWGATAPFAARAAQCRESEPDTEAPLRQVVHELSDTGLRVMPALGYARMLAHPSPMAEAPAPAARLSRVAHTVGRCN